MGLEYEVNIGIGYHYLVKDALAPFAVAVPAETRQEPRYDPKTGAPARPETVVVRPARTDYRVGDRVFSDLDDDQEDWAEDRAVARLAELAGCDYTRYGGEDAPLVCFHPELPAVPDSALPLTPRVDLGSEYPFHALVLLADEFDRVGRRLRELGLPAVQPKVGFAVAVS